MVFQKFCLKSQLWYFFRQKLLKEECIPCGKNVTFCQKNRSGKWDFPDFFSKTLLFKTKNTKLKKECVPGGKNVTGVGVFS